jgi:hypothetical protein
MAKFESPLNNLKVASPCSQDWNRMAGNDRRRYCGECKLNVYNLSGMTRAEAENLILNAEGRLCVRFYQRADGTVLTEDCPVGWAKAKQRARIIVTAAASLLFSFFGALGLMTLFSKSKDLGFNIPIPFVTPTPPPLMGAVTMPSPSPQKSPTPKATPKRQSDAVVGELEAPTPKPLVKITKKS